MFDPDRVLECAREIRYFLPDLVGDRAPILDSELAILLQRAQFESTHHLIVDVLKRDSNTRNWAAEYLSLTQSAKGFQSLPGHGEAVAAVKYICPQGDYVWYRRSVALTPPTCPTHGNLIPADQR